jgi:hypothetical protein
VSINYPLKKRKKLGDDGEVLHAQLLGGLRIGVAKTLGGLRIGVAKTRNLRSLPIESDLHD